MAEAPTPKEIKAMIRATYNAASEHFDDPQLSFWNLVGSRTVELAGVQPGHRVLDVCCGSGASALPAALRAGSSGRIVGVDFAEKLLELGRSKAEQQGLTNTSFVTGDMTDLQFESESFDVVACVFGLFFAPDMVAALQGMWEKVAPGGTIAITAWGKRVLEPGDTIFWESLDTVRPDLNIRTPAWFRLSTPENFAGLFEEAGLPRPDLTIETFTTPLSPEDYWTVIEGSGYRGPIDSMKPEEAARMHELIAGRLAAESDGTLVSDVLYGRAVKPS